MISTRLKQFLDENQVGYDVMQHPPAFTAQQLAARLHVPGREFVKVVVVKLNGSYALAVLPAPLRIQFKALAAAAGVKKCQLASESEFQQLFSDCELGAMPPFGTLYNLPTYADQSLTADSEIVFNAGTHAEAVRMGYADYARLSNVRVATFGEPPPAEVAARKRAAAAKAKAKKKARKKAAQKAPKKKKPARPKKKAKARRKARTKKRTTVKRRKKRR